MSDIIPVQTASSDRIPWRVWQHTSLAVTDVDIAMRFYQNAFGFETLFVVRGMDREIARISGVEGLRCDLAQIRLTHEGQTHEEHLLELIAFKYPTGGHPVSPSLMRGHISFHVPDLDQALAIAQQHGAVMLGEITSVAEGRSVYCQEPAGSLVELEEIWDASIPHGGAL